MDFDAPALTPVIWPFDLQNLIRSPVRAGEYSLRVSSRMLKPFMRYRNNKVSGQTNKWTNMADKQPKNITPFPTLSDDESTKVLKEN